MHAIRGKINLYGFVIGIGAVILLYLSLFDILNYSTIHILPDEFGYWSVAAYFSGKDWSGVTSHIAYYSYGYGMLLSILMRFVDTPQACYQGAILLNAVLLQGIYGLSICFQRSIFPKLNKFLGVFLAFVSSCYVSNLVYVRVAWPEVLLTFCFWLLCLLLLSFIRKPSYSKAIMLPALAMFMYITHQRSLGIVVALCILVFVLMLQGYTSYWYAFVFGGSLGCAYLLQKALKMHISDHVWNHSVANYAVLWKESLLIAVLLVLWAVIEKFGPVFRKMLKYIPITRKQFRVGLTGLITIGIVAGIFYMMNHLDGDISSMDVNDYKGVLSNLRYTLFSSGGFAKLLYRLFGRLYYVGVATGWVAVWGMVQATRQAMVLWRNSAAKQTRKRNCDEPVVTASVSGLCLFLVLSLCFSIGISSLFMISGERQDVILYGRYSEFVLGPLLLLGVITLFYTTRKTWPIVFTMGLFGLSLALTYNAFRENTNYSFNINSSLAVVQYFEDGVSGLETILPLGFGTLLVFAIGATLSFLPIWNHKPLRKCRKWCCLLFFVISGFVMWKSNATEMLNSIQNTHVNVQSLSSKMTDVLEELDITDSMDVLYFVAEESVGNTRLAELLQFELPDCRVCYLDMNAPDTLEILENNTEHLLMVKNNYSHTFSLYERYYYIEDIATDHLDEKSKWRVMLPMESQQVERLKQDGIQFRNTKEGILYTKEGSASQNLQNSGDGFWRSNGEAGYLAYGQYDTYPPGNYVFEADLTTVHIAGLYAIADVAIAGKVLAQEWPPLSDYLDPGMTIHCEVPFTLEEATSDVEFRIFTSLGIEIQIDRLLVRKVE